MKKKLITPEEWEKKHKRCPVCGNDKILTTLIGSVWDTSKDYEDDINTYHCDCGSHGKVKNLVE